MHMLTCIERKYLLIAGLSQMAIDILFLIKIAICEHKKDHCH